MSFYTANTRILEIEFAGEYLPIACVESNDFTESVEMLDTTTQESGGWASSIPTNQTYSISFSGVQKNNAGYTLSFAKLQGIKRNRERVLWRLVGGELQDEGSGYITDLSETAEGNGFIGFSGSLMGFGTPADLRGDLFQNSNDFLFQNGNRFEF